MTTASTIKTAEQLLSAGDIGRCELVQGELKMMSPSGYRHGRVTAALAHVLRQHVRSCDLGSVTGAESGFLLRRNPDTVRAPDAAFITKERLVDAPERGFFPGAPDLAVEVLSPNDSAAEVLRKAQDWLAAGACEAWIVDPERRTVEIRRSDGPARILAEDEAIPGGELLPGLDLPVRELFA